jgi:hypothetical protein
MGHQSHPVLLGNKVFLVLSGINDSLAGAFEVVGHIVDKVDNPLNSLTLSLGDLFASE